jgi:hypothetical protein
MTRHSQHWWRRSSPRSALRQLRQVFTARVDRQFTQLHNVTAVYQRGRLRNLRQFGGGNRLAESLQGTRRNSDALSVSDNFVLNATRINQARSSIQYWLPVSPLAETSCRADFPERLAC